MHHEFDEQGHAAKRGTNLGSLLEKQSNDIHLISII